MDQKESEILKSGAPVPPRASDVAPAEWYRRAEGAPVPPRASDVAPAEWYRRAEGAPVPPRASDVAPAEWYRRAERAADSSEASDIAPAEWYRGASAASAKSDQEVEGNYNPKASNEIKGITYAVINPLPENSTLFDDVNKNRTDLYKDYRKIKLFNWIFIGIVLVLVIAAVAIALIMAGDEEATWTPYVIWPLFGVIVVMFVISFIFTRINKKKFGARFDVFLNLWENDLFAATYLTEDGVVDATLAVNGKAKDVEVINTHYWSVINSLDSRARFICKYLGLTLTDTELIVDCPPYSSFAESIEEAKAQSGSEIVIPEGEADEAEKNEDAKKASKRSNRSAACGAFGKFISYDYKAKDGDAIIIVRKTYDTYLPTNVNGLVWCPEQAARLGEDFEIWASTTQFADQVLTPDMIADLTNLKLGPVLIDWFFAFNKHETAVMLNLSDDIMELPFRNAPIRERLEEYQESVHDTLNILKDLKKTGLGE